MPEILQPYLAAVWCLLTMGGLILVQLLVADVVGLTNGHVPGSAITSSHSSFHFRATRAHANTNESVTAFLLLVLAGLALGAAPKWVNMLSVVYCLARVAHMCFYWLNFSTLRSISFIVGLAALAGLLLVSILSAI